MPFDLALRYFRSNDVPRARKLLVAGAVLAYVLLPVDAVPDFIPWLGWLDDAGVVGLALAFMSRDLRGRAGERREAPASGPLAASALGAPLPGGIEVIPPDGGSRRSG